MASERISARRHRRSDPDSLPFLADDAAVPLVLDAGDCRINLAAALVAAVGTRLPGLDLRDLSADLARSLDRTQPGPDLARMIARISSCPPALRALEQGLARLRGERSEAAEPIRGADDLPEGLPCAPAMRLAPPSRRGSPARMRGAGRNPLRAR